MSEERKERCETCRFWDSPRPDAVGYGTCRRFPPIKLMPEEFAEGGHANVGEWPDTASYDWCGEWRAKVELESKADQIVRFIELKPNGVIFSQFYAILDESRSLLRFRLKGLIEKGMIHYRDGKYRIGRAPT